LFPEIDAVAQGGKLLLDEFGNYSHLEVRLPFSHADPPVNLPELLPPLLWSGAGEDLL
jgi:hypothetical protein